jgi:hypothetical protein
MKKDLLVAYRLQGTVAEKLFTSNVRAAEASEIEDPKEGMVVLVSAKLGELQELRQGLEATLRLIKDKDLDEFLADVEHINKLGEEAARIVVAASALLAYSVKDNADEDA